MAEEPSEAQRQSLADLLAGSEQPIFSYTRADAIADGVLVPVPEADLRASGFSLPMCVNSSVYDACGAEDLFPRLRMLAQCYNAVAAREVRQGEDRVHFSLHLPDGDLLPVVLHCGPADDLSPCLTLCEPRDL